MHVLVQMLQYDLCIGTPPDSITSSNPIEFLAIKKKKEKKKNLSELASNCRAILSWNELLTILKGRHSFCISSLVQQDSTRTPL